MKNLFNINFPKSSPYGKTNISDRKVAQMIGKWSSITGRTLWLDISKAGHVGLVENGEFLGSWPCWKVYYAFETSVKALTENQPMTKDEFYELVEKSDNLELVKLLDIFIKVFDKDFRLGEKYTLEHGYEREQARKYIVVYKRYGEWYNKAKRNLKTLLKRRHSRITPVLDQLKK